jgi:hypothetical protein
VIVVAVALALAACRDRAREAEARATAAAASIERPAWGDPAARAPEPVVRILVGPRGVDVDDLAAIAAWPEPVRRGALASLPEEQRAGVPFAHERVVRAEAFRLAPPDDLAPDRLHLQALHDVLAFAGELDRAATRAAGGEPTYEHRANVIAHADAPYGLVAGVLFTASQAEHVPVPIARGPAGDVALPIEVPRSGQRICGPLVRLAGADVTVTMGGLALGPVAEELESALEALTGVDATGPRHAAAPKRKPRRSLAGKALVAPDRACPALPPWGPPGARAKLVGLLAGFAKALRSCDLVTIAATRDARWATVVALADAAREAGYPRFQLGLSRGDEAAPSCTDAIAPEDVSDDDVPAWR